MDIYADIHIDSQMYIPYVRWTFGISRTIKMRDG